MKNPKNLWLKNILHEKWEWALEFEHNIRVPDGETIFAP